MAAGIHTHAPLARPMDSPRSRAASKAGLPSHRADIQGLRALAVTAVVLYHGGNLLPGGYLGVDLFFVLSGYVISASLFRELRLTGRVSVVRFAIRRVYRLLPAFIAFMLATAAAAFCLWPVSLLPAVGDAASAAATIRANLFFYTQGDYFDASEHLNPLLHTWSLSVEEQFYLFWPWVFVAVGVASRRKGGGGGRFAVWGVVALIALVAVVSFAAFVGWEASGLFISFVSAPARFVFFSPVTRAWEFCAGAVIVPLVDERRRTASPVSSLLQPLSLAVLLAAFGVAGVGREGHLSVVAVLATVLSTMVALANGPSVRPRGIGRVLESRPLAWIGDRSYAWYLWHWPAIAALNVLGATSKAWLVAAGVLALVPAAACYRWIEEPWRRRGRNARAWHAVGVVVVSVSVGAGVHFGGDAALNGVAALGIEGEPRLVRAERPTLDRRLGCDLAPDEPSRIKPACHRAVDGATGLVWLVGDSHAGAISDVVASAAADTGLSTTILVRSGCPVSAVERAGWPTCHDHYQWLVGQISVAPPAAMVVAQRATRYGDRTTADIVCPAEASTDYCDGTDPFFSGLHHFLGIAAQAGVPVIYVRSPPEYERPPNDCVLVGRDGCLDTMPRRYSDERRARIDTRMSATLRSLSNVVEVDPFEMLCDDDSCLTGNRGAFFYRDSHHLSVDGAEVLRAEIGRRLASVVE